MIIFYTAAWSLEGALDASGITVGLWATGTTAYTLVVTVVRYFTC